MKKLKPLLPTLKEKKRYLAFEVLSKNPISGFEAVSSAIYAKMLHFIGELATSKAGIMVLGDLYNAQKQRGIIKVSNRYVDELRASLCMISSIEGKNVIARSIGLSGMLNKAKRYL